MSQIEIFLDGRNFSKKGSAWSMILIGPSIGKGNKKHVWERSFDAEKVTTNQATLYAILFALKSVKKDIRGKWDIHVRFDNKFAGSVFDRDNDGWKRKPSSNIDLVTSIRNTAEEFLPNIRFEVNKEHDMISKAKQLTEMIVNDKKAVDNRS